jgi:NDP-sugar pyrophosphorylase family protein
MKAMVLAAGVGSRLDPLTSQIPKPMVPIANKPVMEHILALLKGHQITDIAANLHHLPDKLTDYFGDGGNFGVKLNYLYEKELSGDAGGVRGCRSFLEDGTFIIIMGDSLTDCDLTAIVAKHKSKKALATIVLKKVDDVSQFGVALTNDQGFITGFQEKPTQEEALSALASTGIYILEPEVFNYIPETGAYGFGRQLFPKLVTSGLPVLGVETTDYWSDVGTIKQYRLSNFAALDGEVQLSLPGRQCEFGYIGQGATVGSGCRVEGKLMLGNNSHLEGDVVIAGHVIIGDNCTIGRGARIEDSIVWSDSCVESRATLSDSVIGMNCCVPMGSNHIEVATV